MIQNHSGVTIIGFGEAGAAIASGLACPVMTAYDIKIDDPALQKTSEIESYGVTAAPDMATALTGTTIIFSVVTADQALAAARAAAAHIAPDTLFLDCNSCAPSTKIQSAAIITAAGGRYIDVAIMAPIQLRAHKTPMLISGESADDAQTTMQALDMDVTVVGRTVGRASTIKMLRSVMIKGIEALSAECFRAACRAGVAGEVAASLDASQSQLGWTDQTTYNLERMTTHGIRRAAEMREVAKTLSDLGVSSAMTNGTIDWQQSFGDLQLDLSDIDGLHHRIATIDEIDTPESDILETDSNHGGIAADSTTGTVK